MTDLAVSLPFPRVDTRSGLDLVRHAADVGYGSCWASEVQGPDAFTQLAALAATTDLDLGVAVVPVQTRTAMILGMSAVTLSEISGGRFTLGIGSSSEVVARDWAGQPFEAPYTHVKETVEALRPMLRGERGSFDGRFVSTSGYRPHATPDSPVPLYVAALGPRMLRLAGAEADGVCLNQLGPDHVGHMMAEVRSGADAAGRELAAEYGVVARLFCAVTDDVPEARSAVKRMFAPYVATSVYNAFYSRLGYEAEAAAVAEASDAGDRDAMTAAMSDRLVDDLFVLGDAAAVAEKVRSYVNAGVTVPVIAPVMPDIASARQTIEGIADHW